MDIVSPKVCALKYNFFFSLKENDLLPGKLHPPAFFFFQEHCS